MELQKITDKIAELQRALKTAPATVKDKIKKKVSELKQAVRDAKVPTRKLAISLLGSQRKVAAYSTQEFNNALKRLSYKAEYSFLKGATKGKMKEDLGRHSKPVGWRFKGKNNYKKPTAKDIASDAGKPFSKRKTYMESRRNRSDVVFPVKLATGGSVKRYSKEEEYRYLPSGSIEKEMLNKVNYEQLRPSFVGNFGWKTDSGKMADGYLFSLDAYDNNLIMKNVPLRQGEQVFRYLNRTTTIGGMTPMIKINLEKGLLYFPINNDDDTISFETRGIKSMWINIIDKMEHGGATERENAEMVANNNKQIAHHTEEMRDALKKTKNVPAWVVAKVNRSANDLSDATHYLDGQNEKFATGGGLSTEEENRFKELSEKINAHLEGKGKVSTKEMTEHAKLKHKRNLATNPMYKSQMEWESKVEREGEFANGGGVDGEYKIGDKINEPLNSKWEDNWQLFKPRTSYVLDDKEVISIHKTPNEAIEQRQILEKKLNKPNLKLHWKPFPPIQEHIKEIMGSRMTNGGGVKKPTVNVFRSPYYEMTDGISGFEMAAENRGDEQLLKLVKEAKAINDKIYKYLENNYTWD